MQAEVDAFAGEGDAFEFETEALFECGIQPELDLSSCAEHTLPGQRVGWIVAQKTCDGAVIKRVSGGGGDLSVGGDFTFRYRTNDAPERLIAEFVRAKPIPKQGASHFGSGRSAPAGVRSRSRS
jgi:hypothetical protein